MTNDRITALEDALEKMLHAVCGETGFASCVRGDSGYAYPWPALDEAEEASRAALAASRAAPDCQQPDLVTAQVPECSGRIREITEADMANILAHLSYECEPAGPLPNANSLMMEIVRLRNELAALDLTPAPAVEPVAWGESYDGGKFFHTASVSKTKHHTIPLYAAPPVPTAQDAARVPDDFQALLSEAMSEASRAMVKFPQPNYVISKFAEESGEVVKAAIHHAEGRETRGAVVGEMRQVLAMMLRMWIEGDQVHGLPALRAIGGDA